MVVLTSPTEKDKKSPGVDKKSPKDKKAVPKSPGVDSMEEIDESLEGGGLSEDYEDDFVADIGLGSSKGPPSSLSGGAGLPLGSASLSFQQPVGDFSVDSAELEWEVFGVICAQ